MFGFVIREGWVDSMAGSRVLRYDAPDFRITIEIEGEGEGV